MNIHDTAFSSLHQRQQREPRRGEDNVDKSFRQVLEQVGEQDGAQAAALRPSVGSHARRFQDRPLVTLTAVDIEEVAPSAQPDQQNAEQLFDIEKAAKEVGDAIDKLMARSISRRSAERSGNGEQFAYDFTPSHLGRNPKVHGLETAQSVASRDGGSATANQSASIGNSAPFGPSQQTISAARTSPENTSATHRSARAEQQKASGSNSPFSAMLTTQENGLRLVIRAPTLSAQEKERLELRIARLFAERGIPTPETIIHNANAPSTGAGN